MKYIRIHAGSSKLCTIARLQSTTRLDFSRLRDSVLATELIFIEVTNYNKMSLIFFIFHFKYVNNTRLICIDKGSPSRLAIAHEHVCNLNNCT